MQKLDAGGWGLVLALAFTSGCGGNGSDQGSASVDPATLDFCLHWANGVCRLAYLCVDASAQDAAFHARYGKSQDDCWQSVEKYCTSNQSGGFGPGCGPGKKVNSTAANACTDDLDTDSCVDWAAAPGGACDAVCGTANTGGAGGTGAGGTGAGGTHAGGTGAGGTGAGGTGVSGAGGASVAGSSGNASTGSLATQREFCEVDQSVQCDRAFECFATAAAATFGTLAECKSLTISACATGDYCPSSYDATQAAGCVAATKAATCEQLQGDPPAVCTAACGQ